MAEFYQKIKNIFYIVHYKAVEQYIFLSIMILFQWLKRLRNVSLSEFISSAVHLVQQIADESLNLYQKWQSFSSNNFLKHPNGFKFAAYLGLTHSRRVSVNFMVLIIC